MIRCYQSVNLSWYKQRVNSGSMKQLPNDTMWNLNAQSIYNNNCVGAVCCLQESFKKDIWKTNAIFGQFRSWNVLRFFYFFPQVTIFYYISAVLSIYSDYSVSLRFFDILIYSYLTIFASIPPSPFWNSFCLKKNPPGCVIIDSFSSIFLECVWIRISVKTQNSKAISSTKI